jgi:rod shape determining protein RodA
VKRSGRLDLPSASVRVSRWRRFNARFDWVLLGTVLAIAGIGLLNLYSATDGTRHAAKFDQQVRHFLIGLGFFGVFAFMDYRALVRLGWPILGIAIAAIVIVYFLGDAAEAKGAHRWINVGPLRLQPSEPVKIAIILAMARMLQDSDIARYEPLEILPRLAALAMPAALIMLQPDLGTAILVVLISLTVAFLAVPNLWPVSTIALTVMASIPLLWEKMAPYQQKRVLAFLDPASDPTGAGWHTQQSIFAVGSGQVTGKGYMAGTQNQFDFLPEHWTDFPFSVWAEEWGFLGSVGLLILFGFLLAWILNIAMEARDRSGAIICVGVAAMTFWHLVVNLGMVLGLAPVVGVTLPFISYGGSSLITFFIAMGLVASVSLRRHGY